MRGVFRLLRKPQADCYPPSNKGERQMTKINISHVICFLATVNHSRHFSNNLSHLKKLAHSVVGPVACSAKGRGSGR